MDPVDISWFSTNELTDAIWELELYENAQYK